MNLVVCLFGRELFSLAFEWTSAPETLVQGTGGNFELAFGFAAPDEDAE